jgi:methionine-rich copper-binding protein CopC
MPKVILILLCLLFPLSALAHSPLSNVLPGDGAKLEDAPTEISMVFKSPAKLIKLELLKVQATTKKSLLGSLFGNDGGEVVPLPNAVLMEMSATHVIPLPEITSGGYQVKWRAMGEDGHVIKGDFVFAVDKD